MTKKECEVHFPSRAMGFLMMDTAAYCATCDKKLEDGDPVTHQPVDPSWMWTPGEQLPSGDYWLDECMDPECPDRATSRRHQHGTKR